MSKKIQKKIYFSPSLMNLREEPFFPAVAAVASVVGAAATEAAAGAAAGVMAGATMAGLSSLVSDRSLGMKYRKLVAVDRG